MPSSSASAAAAATKTTWMCVSQFHCRLWFRVSKGLLRRDWWGWWVIYTPTAEEDFFYIFIFLFFTAEQDLRRDLMRSRGACWMANKYTCMFLPYRVFRATGLLPQRSKYSTSQFVVIGGRHRRSEGRIVCRYAPFFGTRRSSRIGYLSRAGDILIYSHLYLWIRGAFNK